MVPVYDKRLMPQLQQQGPATGPNNQRLTVSQQSELEMARRRAEKAAEGKRANASAARHAAASDSDGLPQAVGTHSDKHPAVCASRRTRSALHTASHSMLAWPW